MPRITIGRISTVISYWIKPTDYIRRARTRKQDIDFPKLAKSCAKVV